jgi:hypothetical protein
LHDAPRYYILVGDEGTWNVALSNNLWGFSEKSRGFWNTSSDGDCLAFYVTDPLKRVIGFGKIKRKFIDDTIVFPDEKLFGKGIWKYRIEFDKIQVAEDWMKNGITVPSTIMLNTGRRVVDADVFKALVRRAERKWAVRIREKF